MTIGSPEEYSDSIVCARHAQDAKIRAIKDEYKPMLDTEIPASLRQTRSGPILHYGFCLEIPRGEQTDICQDSWSRVLDHIDSQTHIDTSKREGIKRFTDAGGYAMSIVRQKVQERLKKSRDCPALCTLQWWDIDLVTENQQIAGIMLYTNQCSSIFRLQEHHVQIVVDVLEEVFIPPGVTNPIDIHLRWYYDGQYRKEAYIMENEE